MLRQTDMFRLRRNIIQTVLPKNDYKWEEQDDFGRSGTSMKLMPNISSTLNDNSVYLEYDVNF